jgi:hypothetical protein
MKTSPTIVAPNTPVIPPSTSTVAPQKPPAGPQSSTNPIAGEHSPKEVIPVSSERKDESCSGNVRAVVEEAEDKEEEEEAVAVTSADKAEAPADDAIVFALETDEPSDWHATPKAYASASFCFSSAPLCSNFQSGSSSMIC